MNGIWIVGVLQIYFGMQERVEIMKYYLFDPMID